MEGESFSPPTIEIVGAKANENSLFPEDDVLALEIDGYAANVQCAMCWH